MSEARQSQGLGERKALGREERIQAHGEVEERLPPAQGASVQV
jgi:hypothetical protein